MIDIKRHFLSLTVCYLNLFSIY